MREIKFRAWDKNKNRMLSHSDLYAMDCRTDYPFLALIKGYYANSGARFLDGIDPVTMQYTGLKDKNGREIYDGDIVNAWSQGYKGRFEVKWRQEGSPCWILYPAWKNNEFWKIHGTLHEDGQFYDKGLEVIGNIYENPEFLEEKQ